MPIDILCAIHNTTFYLRNATAGTLVLECPKCAGCAADMAAIEQTVTSLKTALDARIPVAPDPDPV